MTSNPERESTCLSRRRFCSVLAAAPMLPWPARAAENAGTSAWSVSDHARVRLVSAGVSPTNSQLRLAGIEMVLDPQYLTYWRSPGDAGVAPVARFEGSVNLKTATLLYPAPGRYSEDGSEAIGYKNSVIFPVLVAGADAAKDVSLLLDLSFATCERLCVPAHAQAKLALGGDDGDPEAMGRVRDAFAHVPQVTTIAAPGALAITSVTGDSGQGSVTVLARISDIGVPLLFAEAPDPWFVQAGAGLWTNDGSLKYTVNILSRPADPAPLPLRLTLVGPDGGIEVPFTVDAPPPKP